MAESKKTEDNPYSFRMPHSLCWKGSVIPRVLPPSIICVLVAVAVTCVQKFTSTDLSIPQMFIPVLGFVVALLLTYRTNTAYDRFVLLVKVCLKLRVIHGNLTRPLILVVRQLTANTFDQHCFANTTSGTGKVVVFGLY
jgi:predicted membrane chloride channel (bestrophin family)